LAVVEPTFDYAGYFVLAMVNWLAKITGGKLSGLVLAAIRQKTAVIARDLGDMPGIRPA
jgi:hypothetical protein